MTSLLITGGDGYLGRQIVDRYLAGSDLDILVAVRAADATELAMKTERIGQLGPRARVVPVDLTAPDPFADLDARRVTHVIHSAAVTRFNVDHDTARRVNLAGTEKLLEFAARCPNLERVSVLSTVYSSGLTPGPIREAPHDGNTEFANFYEWSKHEAERVLLGRFAQLPWQLLRVATAISHDETGLVRQFNAFHNTLKLYFYGMLSLLPGDPDTPLYLISGKFAADAIFAIASSGQDGVFHVSHSYTSALTLQQLIDKAFDCFGQDDGFRKRRVLRPVYADRESYDIYANGVGAFASPAVTQAVASMNPFAPQLYIHKELSTDRLDAALGQLTPPDTAELVNRTCAYLASTRWGRENRVRCG
jgi:nucleoside-diphosphate-sugar epimerase